METKIKTLYILSIAAILAFLGMQVYWLYTRYEYSLAEYEDIASGKIADAIIEYNKVKTSRSPLTKEAIRVQSSYNMNTDIDSLGNCKRTVTVRTKELNGRKLLGITENRNLTQDEMNRLAQIVLDSIEWADAKITAVKDIDATSAPSDAIAWNAMRNFESELQSPFTVTGLDSILRKENLDGEISLTVQDSLTWSPVTIRHSSLVNPSFKVITPYSELERKAVVVQCQIPYSEVLRQMGRTLVMALVLSLALILCLVWQIKTIARLTRLDKIRNSFIITMIHELKRPISTLKMCVSGFDNDKLMTDSELRHELTGETRIALDNLSAYFSKLRDITFNNVEEIPLNVSSFNLAELVNCVIKSMAVPSDKQVRFEAAIPGKTEISADRAHIQNILTNLIENAIKYSGDEVRIKIDAETTTGGVAISVSDNGNGIASADIAKIFNRFYRGKASTTEIPGMGLGLSYVKLLTDAHGGEISVESNEGEGSKFIIRLPQ